MDLQAFGEIIEPEPLEGLSVSCAPRDPRQQEHPGEIDVALILVIGRKSGAQFSPKLGIFGTVSLERLGMHVFEMKELAAP